MRMFSGAPGASKASGADPRLTSFHRRQPGAPDGGKGSRHGIEDHRAGDRRPPSQRRPRSNRDDHRLRRTLCQHRRRRRGRRDSGRRLRRRQRPRLSEHARLWASKTWLTTLPRRRAHASASACRRRHAVDELSRGRCEAAVPGAATLVRAGAEAVKLEGGIRRASRCCGRSSMPRFRSWATSVSRPNRCTPWVAGRSKRAPLQQPMNSSATRLPLVSLGALHWCWEGVP